MKNGKPKIILYILILIILILVGYLAYKFIMTKKGYGNLNNIEEDNDNDVEEATIIPVPKQDYPVVYKGYEYSLLDGYYYKIDDNYTEGIFVIYKSGIQLGARIGIVKINDYPDNSFTNIDILSNYLIQDDNDIKNGQVFEIDNTTVISFEYQYDGYDAILAYMRAYDDYMYRIFVYDKDEKKYNYDVLNDVVKMLNTRKKVDE